MEMNEYQKLAQRTDNREYVPGTIEGIDIDKLLNGLIGLNGESGEAIDLFKKFFFQGHKLDKNKVIEELGDILWYIAQCARALGTDLETIGQYNIAKLVMRYPDGFSVENSIKRVDYNQKTPEMKEIV